MERRSKALGERGWKNGQRTMRFLAEAGGKLLATSPNLFSLKLERSGDPDMRTRSRRNKRVVPPRTSKTKTLLDLGFDLVSSFFC